jgi:hypothetical protein
MEKFVIAFFKALKSPVAVDSILAYERTEAGERVARFRGNDGKTYIAGLEELVLREAVMVPVA